ncbi:MAG: tetratricopeptide repeat protein [Trueperaceae bacterium]
MIRSASLLALILAVLVTFGHGFAQGLPAEAEAALRTGEARMAEALQTYPAQYPDRPLWQQAFAEGRRAAQFAPESLAPVRFLAEAYSRSQWAGRAWPAWMEFVDRGGVLDEEARELVALVGHELGYGAYARGDLETALEYYLTVSDLVADDIESRVWAGRILIESERPEQAVAFWRSVLELDPTDARAAYFAELAREQATWGTRAVDVFREGVALYEQGAPQAAAERFARATVINPAYPAAWAWLGRVAFEAGDYVDARRAYANAAGLAPDDETYRYFLAQSIARAEAADD